jgi:hypothetical protein
VSDFNYRKGYGKLQTGSRKVSFFRNPYFWSTFTAEIAQNYSSRFLSDFFEVSALSDVELSRGKGSLAKELVNI